MFSFELLAKCSYVNMVYAQFFFQRIHLYHLTEQLTCQLRKVLLLEGTKSHTVFWNVRPYICKQPYLDFFMYLHRNITWGQL